MSDTMLHEPDYWGSFTLIGSIDDIQNIDKSKEYFLGDIIYSKANRASYVYTNNGEFVRLESTCNDTDSSTLKMKPHPTNCVNCGAVLKDYRCEYCGTVNIDTYQ